MLEHINKMTVEEFEAYKRELRVMARDTRCIAEDYLKCHHLRPAPYARAIGIDPGTSKMTFGVAVVENDTEKTISKIKPLSFKRLGRIGIVSEIEALITETNANVIFMENFYPFGKSSARTNVQMKVIIHFIEGYFLARGIPVYIISPKAWKDTYKGLKLDAFELACFQAHVDLRSMKIRTNDKLPAKDICRIKTTAKLIRHGLAVFPSETYKTPQTVWRAQFHCADAAGIAEYGLNYFDLLDEPFGLDY